MVFVVLADRLLFEIILTMLFSYGIEMLIVGEVILILKIIFHILKPT